MPSGLASPRWLLAWSLSALLLARLTEAAAVCPNTGLVSPQVPTLIAAPDNPQLSAWIVGPDCDKEVLGIDSKFVIVVAYKGIERVDSMPTLPGLSLTGNPLTRGGNFSTRTSIALEGFSLSGLQNFILPESVYLADVPLKSITTVPFSSNTISITLEKTQLQSLKGVAKFSALLDLRVYSSKLSKIDSALPPALKSLRITKSELTEINGIVFPDELSIVDLTDNKISVVKGVSWPVRLDSLELGNNALVEFEIRASDEATFSALRTLVGDFSQVKCTQPTAELKQILSKNVCVISDELFESLYRTPTVTTPPPRATKKPATSTNGSVGPTNGDEDSLPDEEGGATTDSSSETTPADRNTQPSSNSNSNSTNSNSSGGVNGSQSTTSTRTPTQSDSGSSAGRTGSRTTIIETETSSNRTLVIAFGVVSGLIAVVFSVWLYRACFMKGRKENQDVTTSGKYSRMETPGASTQPDASNPVSNLPSDEYLMNDVRNDKAMLAFRVGQKDVKLSKQIARGGYGVIYRGVYNGTDVAVKQMLPGAWHDDRALTSFMDEIRLCASLHHPKIVAFVGITYSSLRDLSIIIEFRPGGDLLALLQKQQTASRSPRDWSRTWTSSQIKCKASIGKDVAEAVAYLHSLETPIIHRDLKARNVLLDLQGNAKLSDFGISRELTVDETMTSEVGTAAWIAPEVLRGARYSEKADVYSLGVLLVELDRCQHPYADEEAQQKDLEPEPGTVGDKPSTISCIAQQNTRIAVLVSTGKLRPSVSSDCPREVTSLVSQCLSFNPESRPSAAEVAAVLGGFVQG